MALTSFLTLFCDLQTVEEKKPVKRSYQKVHDDEDDEDDDYRSHISPHSTDASAAQLVRQEFYLFYIVPRFSFFSLTALYLCRPKSW